MRESFVFYRSFYDTLRKIPAGDRLRAYELLARCALLDESPDALPYPFDAIIGQMLASVDAAHRRYDASVESGKKGGRPRRWIEREEAERLFSELGTWSKVAEALDVSDDTLYRARLRWKSDDSDTAKPQNLNVNDNVNVNVNDNETLTINNKENATAGRAQSASPRRDPSREERLAVARRLKETMPGKERGSVGGHGSDTS